MAEKQIIPAISNHKKLETFLASERVTGILMNFHLAQLDHLVTEMKHHGKKVLIHAELIKGLSGDEGAAIYLIQTLHVDGIISSKPRVIDICKKRGVLGVFRFFVKDTVSFRQSMAIAKRLKPTHVEILPGCCVKLIEPIKKQLHCDVWMGGMIQTAREADACFNAGAQAITTSHTHLW